MRLDHLIATVPDIRASHARLLAMGFEEAWPVGPFWPAAQTSGIALGGANLELVQPDEGVGEARIDTLVLTPESIEESRDFVRGGREEKKVEPDPALLALRGFPAKMRTQPQTICTNLYPANPPYPYFLCLYSSFLKKRLAPASYAQPRGPMVGLILRTLQPEAVRHLFAGRLGPLGLGVDPGERSEVAKICFADGSSLTADHL